MSELLKINKLTKIYSGVNALNEVSFSVHRGEVHALCGENGAGKSTLIKILTGAIQPTRGHFEFDGVKYEGMSPSRSIEAGIRTIYQEFTLIPYLTVSENLFYGHEIMRGGRCNRAEMNRLTEQLCEEMGVDLDPNAKIVSLGIAQQQIVEILKAVSQKAKLFIMDEPTAPLTVKETAIFFNIIRKLKQEGATIIFISHRLEEVFELCDRVTVLCDGQFVVTRDTAELDQKQLIAYMVGRELSDDYLRGEKSSVQNEIILEVQNLRNNHVRDVSFDLHRGEILGFGGLVGAGRTEMARAIFGADPISSGNILLKGKKYTPKNPGYALERGIGLIPEDRKHQGLIMEMSIRKNISIGILKRISTMAVIHPDAERACARRFIADMRIRTPSDQQLVKNLSGGNQQKVVLSKIMAMNCDVLIFDEPTRGIDVGAKQEIYGLIRELARSGKGIIMISSEMPELIGMSDRILVMSNGYAAKMLERDAFSQVAILEAASSRLKLEE